MLSSSKGDKGQAPTVQVSEPRKNCQLRFQRSQTSLVGTEEIAVPCQGDWPLRLPVLTPLPLQLKGSVGAREDQDCCGALDFPSCRGFGCNRGEIVSSHHPAAAACPHTAKLVVKQGRMGGRASKAETPFASFAADFSTLSSLRHSLQVLLGSLCLG